MTEKPAIPAGDHHLINRRNRELKLRAQRSQILKMDSEAALDALLDAPSPATLIQSALLTPVAFRVPDGPPGVPLSWVPP